MIARQLLMMPRPGWITGWHIGGCAGREGKAEAVARDERSSGI